MEITNECFISAGFGKLLSGRSFEPWYRVCLGKGFLNKCNQLEDGNFEPKVLDRMQIGPTKEIFSEKLILQESWRLLCRDPSQVGSCLQVSADQDFQQKNAIIVFIHFYNLFVQGFFFRCLFRHWVISRRSNLGVGGDLLVIDHPLSLAPPSLLRVGRT